MLIKKNRSIHRRFRYDKKIDVLFKGVEWLIYSGFCMIAAHFMYDVLEQYQKKDTFMGQSLEPIDKLPTIIFCLDTRSSWLLNMTEISYKIRNHYHILRENETLFFNETGETVALEQTYNSCFKVMTSIERFKKGLNRFIQIKFDKYPPYSINAYFTSEENSYGNVNHQWFDGKVFDTKMERGHLVSVSLWPKEYKFLNQDGQCL